MAETSFLPLISKFDVERAAQLIQQAYAPPTISTSPNDLKQLQHELFELQKRPEAWGLVIPFLDHPDPNVQFFGAHTAQVKIARDWSLFPQENALQLRDLILQLASHSMTIGRSKVILRKLFVALSSLALKLVPGHPSRWPDWILACVMTFSGSGASTEHIHDFLSIVAEEVANADLLGPSKIQIHQSLKDAVPMVIQAVRSSLESSQHVPSALKCLQAWMPTMPSSDITPLIPQLISLLDHDSESFESASDALQEVMAKSALSDGSGSRTLTEPLMVWMDTHGSKIVESTLSSGVVDETSRSFCKLLVALGDHSTAYIANNIVSSTPVVPLLPSPIVAPSKTRGQLTQTFLRLLLAYTGLPGYYGVDEEESEMTLGFWYLFQEALWSTDYYIGEDGEQNGDTTSTAAGSDAQTMAKVVYSELVQVLRRKAAFPPKGSGWAKDQVEKFQVYRRDIGDTLINAQPFETPGLLMSVLTYVASALTDPSLCLQAANALRNLCDANRKALAPQIGAFAELHAALGSIPDSEKSKVVQSIASVIQALPAHDEISPIQAIVDPIVIKLVEAMHSSALLETLSGVAKGLTRSTDGLVILGERDSESQAKLDEMIRAREDPRTVKLRESISAALRGVVELWSTDAGISHALSDLFKSITCLPSDTTLISLQAGPLLELVCIASRRQLTAAWLSLAAILIAQLNPPPPILLNGSASKTGPTPEAVALVASALPILLECALGMMSVPRAMEENPDVVQEFFVCMDRTAQDFTGSFYTLPPGALDALMNCAIQALSLQERYSLVQACNFLCTFINRSSVIEALATEKEQLLRAHGMRIMKAILEGFANIAPRRFERLFSSKPPANFSSPLPSVVPNLIEILGTLLSRAGGGGGGGGGSGGALAAQWIRDILFSVSHPYPISTMIAFYERVIFQDDFVQSKATPDVKEKFVKAVIRLVSRSLFDPLDSSLTVAFQFSFPEEDSRCGKPIHPRSERS
ncbi:hypothetical protein H0H81_010228 [Sphagnurus paluster]|uniref:Exportin-1/Importin-beta-like domain-containing protein n=1 Tax=Sphagnurus paluster TaxID=117069 RepID=A0A9P7K4B4_9AGAR|nr:hypothetical protein H0H81_010228 [Sphagnurus paluster]